MDYQVWTKEEYSETWKKVDCGDMAAVKRELDKALREGKDPLLTAEVPYKLDIKISEVGSEATKSRPKKDKGAGAEGEGEVRPGDLGAVPELDQGSGDPGASDRVLDK